MATQLDQYFPGYDEPADPRSGLRWGRRAFGLMAVALGAHAAVLALQIYVLFAGDRALHNILVAPGFDLYIGIPVTFGSALAAYLMIGRKRDGTWNTSALLLAAMNTFDVLLWLHENARMLHSDFALPGMDNPLLREGVGVLQWFELWLVISLATRLSIELGRPEAIDLARSGGASAIVGLGIWTFALFMSARLQGAGMGGGGRRPHIELYMLRLFSTVLLAATAFQATAACVLAARACGRRLRELRASDDSLGLPVTHSDPFDDHRRDVWPT